MYASTETNNYQLRHPETHHHRRFQVAARRTLISSYCLLLNCISVMDRDLAFRQICFCGRSFASSAAFKRHQNSCKKCKRALAVALTKAKEQASRIKNSSWAQLANTNDLAQTSESEPAPHLENAVSGDVLHTALLCC